MRKIFLLALLFVSGYAMAQPANYVPYQSRVRYIAGMFDSTFHIPRFNGSPSLRTVGSTNDGAIAADTANGRLYMYYNGSWALINKDTANSFLNSIYRKAGTDSVFYVKGGSHTFAFKDSIGSGSGVSVSSFAKNAGRDSIILLLSDGSRYAVKDSLGSGGGSQTLQQTTDLGDSTTGRLVSNDTLKGLLGYNKSYLQVGDSSKSNRIWMVYGTSISNTATPTGITAAQSYTALLAKSLGFQVQNRSKVAGTVIQYSAGDSSIENKIYTIPVYSSSYGMLTVEGPGVNDGYTPLGKPFDTTAAKAALNKFIDTAQARGWPNSLMAIISSPYTTSSQYPNITSYNRAARTVAESQGVAYIDQYTFSQDRGGYTALYDSIHPNAYGHTLYETNVLKSLTNFKKVGVLTVNGPVSIKDSAYIKDSLRIGNITANFGTNGLSVQNDILTDGRIKAGQRLADIDNAKIQANTSAFQVGIVAYNGSANYNRMYAEYSEVRDASSYLRTNPNSFTYSNGITFIGSGTNTNILSLGTYGGIVFNDAGIDSDLRIEGDNETNLFYTDASTDRVGIKTATPDSGFTVLTSVRLGGTVRLSNLPTGKQAKQIYADANGTLYLGDSTVGGGGGGTTYKIGTYNSQTSSVKGATIVSDSIYMQAFSAENPGLVPSGGSNTTYLRGDGTWQTVSGGSVMYVDTIYRKAGQDSIFYKINGGTERAIKDSVGGGSSGWALTGNDPTSGWAQGSFLGTTTNKSLLIRTNNILRARIDSAGTSGTFRLYPGENTTAYIDYGTFAANKWTMNSQGIILQASSDVMVVSNSVNTAGFYNGEVVVGSASATGTTKLRIDNANTTKSVMNWSSTTKKTTAADGDWTRDANGVYFGKSTTWNEILMTASVNTVSPTSPNRTITVVIGGTTYYIHAKTTND